MDRCCPLVRFAVAACTLGLVAALSIVAPRAAAGGQAPTAGAAGRPPAPTAEVADSPLAPADEAPASYRLPVGMVAPVPPATLAQDERGRIVVRAVRLERGLTIDGRLDERVYQEVPAIDHFVQQVPKEGEPGTERTEAWILYDDTYFYFSARLWDSHPERIAANEMRRDGGNIFSGGDSMTLVLDTFFDQRNGFLFQTNPLGAVRDQQIADGQYIESWNTIWQVKSSRFPGGWSLEMQIPFKSLRYRDNGNVIWGINFRRVVRWKNEFHGLTAMPAAFGPSGLGQMQMAAPLVGLVTPSRSRNIELKPYGVSSVTTDASAATPTNNDLKGNFGTDFKYGLTRSLIADVTYNTDFAQIEEDVQQVNLTRFNLLFPEKRDFFLEGQGIYAFGGRSVLGSASGDTNDVPVMFFSRQIGLARGQPVPVIGGARITGKASRYDIAALNMQTAEKESLGAPSTNFSAVRLRRDILRRSNVGVIATMRNPQAPGEATTKTYGGDFSIRFSPNVTALGYYARADTTGSNDSDASYRGNFEWAHDRYGIVAEHLFVGKGFTPSVGMTRRLDFHRDLASLRFSPRLRNSKLMRKLTWQGSWIYYTDAGRTQVQNRTLEGLFNIEFHSGDTLQFLASDDYELLPQNFTISRGVVVPRGGYQNNNLRVQYTRANQRKFAGRFIVSKGALYGGTRRDASYSGRVAFRPQFAIEPGISLSWVRIPFGDFNARLITNRFTYTPTARLQVSSLVQWNIDAKTTSASVRMRWEYILGSELFVVYSDGRDLAGPTNRLVNQTFAVKITRLLRF
ncbi:MAG: DUF5916 domain-containing protein [Vicinamibacterales bacterium]